MQKSMLLCVFIVLYSSISFAQQVVDTVKDKPQGNTLLWRQGRLLYQRESPATFPGGFKGWERYFNQNVRYPPKAKKKKVEDVVFVFLNVDTLGNVSNVRALNNSERKLEINNSTIFIDNVIQQPKLPLNNPGFGLEEEAERLIIEGPKWISAERNGKKVSYKKYVQKVTFQFQ